MTEFKTGRHIPGKALSGHIPGSGDSQQSDISGNEPSQYISRTQLEASLCRDSFQDFVKRFWDIIITEKMDWNWHMGVLCDELQRVAERVFRGENRKYDLVINVPPGTSKSTICSRMFPAWVWTRMPTAQFICGSYAHLLALELSRHSRDIITSEKYMRMFPEVRLADDQNAKGFFVNTKGGFRLAVGTGGVAGFHAHFVVIDDPLDPNNIYSEAELKAANEWVKYITRTRRVKKSLTPSILIMQRLHQDDPAGNMLENSKVDSPVRHICLPAEIVPPSVDDVPEGITAEIPTQYSVKPRRLARYYKDGLLDPVRLSYETLKEFKKDTFMYHSQFLQSPVPIGGMMFKTHLIHLETMPPKEFVLMVRYWDKAGTEGAGAFTVGALMGRDKEGHFWVLDIKRGQWDSDKREKLIVQTAALDGRKVIIGVEQEPGSGGKESAEQTVKRLAGYRVRVDKVTGDKVLRADPFSVQVNGGNVYMLLGEWTMSAIDELTYFPNSRYKDQTDAMSGAFAILSHAKRKVGGIPRK